MTATVRRWPLFLIAAPAAVAIWSGWVGLAALCGFGEVHPLPGINPGFRLDTAITLPVGVEAYGAYALGAWLNPAAAHPARSFAKRSAVGSLTLGMLGPVAYHVLAAAHASRAPWPVVVLVSCLPVCTLGFGAALTHLLRVPVPEAAHAPVPAQSAISVPKPRQDAPRTRTRSAPARRTPAAPVTDTDAEGWAWVLLAAIVVLDFSGAKVVGGELSLGGCEFLAGDVHLTAIRLHGGELDFHGSRFSGGSVPWSAAYRRASRMPSPLGRPSLHCGFTASALAVACLREAAAGAPGSGGLAVLLPG